MKKQCLILTFYMFLFLMNCLESKGKDLFSTHITVINTFSLKGCSLIICSAPDDALWFAREFSLIHKKKKKKFPVFTRPASDDDT